MVMRKLLASLYLCLALQLSVPGLASAAIVTYDFSGVLTQVVAVQSLNGNLPTPLPGASVPAVGQSFSGSLSYDAGTNLWSSPDGSTRTYSSPLTWQITAGGQQYSSFAQPKYGVPDVTVVSVQYGGAFANVPLGTGGRTTVGAALQPGTPEAISMSFKFSSMFDREGGKEPSFFEFYYHLSEQNNSNDIVVKGDITSFSERATPTPLPAAVWLLGSGLVGLAGLRKKIMKA